MSSCDKQHFHIESYVWRWIDLWPLSDLGIRDILPMYMCEIGGSSSDEDIQASKRWCFFLFHLWTWILSLTLVAGAGTLHATHRLVAIHTVYVCGILCWYLEHFYAGICIGGHTINQTATMTKRVAVWVSRTAKNWPIHVWNRCQDSNGYPTVTHAFTLKHKEMIVYLT